MQSLKLVKPNLSYKEQVLNLKKEHRAKGETIIHGAPLLDNYENYEDWLIHLKETENKETIPPEWVLATTFLALRKDDDKLVGMINIRHYLNDFLKSYGGHIGYGVAPSCRGRGYAGEMLSLALDFCKEELKLDRVMVSCNKVNIASAKTIVKNKGVLEREFLHTDGNMVQVYWIAL